MKKLYLTTVVILLSLMGFTQEQKEPTKVNSKHAVGVAAGLTIGCGLAYQYTYSKFSVQGTFLPYIDDEEMYCIGLSFYYTLNQGKQTSLFLYQGNHYYYSQYYVYNEAYFNNGLGIGLEFTILDNVSLNLMAGYAFYNNFTSLNLTGEISLFYNIPSK